MNKIRYNFYTDNEDKGGNSDLFIHFWLNSSGANKVTLKCKVKKKYMNTKATSFNRYLGDDSERINFFLEQVAQLIDEYTTLKRVATVKEVKDSISSFVNDYHGKNTIGKIDRSKTPTYSYTFIDLFAGAGGFSEGFMQAYTDDKWFDFLLGSDIDENCELTHHVRYNHQMGLGSKFLRKNITDHDFINELKTQLAGQDVDVIAGGPPCQSFSLAGRRREFDVKNDLFYHYLKVIRELKPKYFVMENVKGIANKEGGKIKKEILSQIRSIVSDDSIEMVKSFFSDLKKLRNSILKKDKSIKNNTYNNSFIKDEDEYINALLIKFEYEITNNAEKKERLRNQLIDNIEKPFNLIVRLEYVPYQFNKSNEVVRAFRQYISMLRNKADYDKYASELIKQKSKDNIDGTPIADDFDVFLTKIDNREISNKLSEYSDELQELIFDNGWVKRGSKRVTDRIIDIKDYLHIYELSYDGCVEELKKRAGIHNKKYGFEGDFNNLLEKISLYKITDEPLILDSSNYNVPQKRERVVFLGCRRDQKFIQSIPANTSKPLKLKVAIDDLDTNKKIGRKSKFATKSIKGRMPKWYKVGPPFYVKSFKELEEGKKYLQKNGNPLNSERSNQNDVVKNRLKIIREKGGYEKAKKLLDKKGLLTGKRNYNLLNPKKPGPTMVTLPDDFIHYNDPRPLTVREMARIQSFDDDFVFQGKRTTGGHRRKMEIPQYTLVGNAIPPLMAKAIAKQILSVIT